MKKTKFLFLYYGRYYLVAAETYEAARKVINGSLSPDGNITSFVEEDMEKYQFIKEYYLLHHNGNNINLQNWNELNHYIFSNFNDLQIQQITLVITSIKVYEKKD